MQQEPTGLWEGGETIGLLILKIDVYESRGKLPEKLNVLKPLCGPIFPPLDI